MATSGESGLSTGSSAIGTLRAESLAAGLEGNGLSDRYSDMAAINDYQGLEVWQIGGKLAKAVCQATTKSFCRDNSHPRRRESSCHKVAM